MAFAGNWYPAGAKECIASIEGFLKAKPDKIQPGFLAGIVPHASWFYSGHIACRVIAGLQPDDNTPVDTVLLFGAHMHKQSEPFIMTRGQIETPLGEIEVDEELVEKICSGISIRQRAPSRFPDDNTLELQYPFIKYFFPKASIVVCGVAPSFFAPIIGSMAVREATAMGRNIRVIGSTDMTHYGPDFGFTPEGAGEKAVKWVRDENDRQAIAAMKQMDEERIIAQGLTHKNMCCPGAAAATAAAAKKMGAVKAIELDYATSYEKSGSDSFVGYSGVVYALP